MISYFTFAATIVIVTATAGIISAEETNNINDPAVANSPRSTSVNKNFQLDIDSERIIEQDYQSSTSILFGEDNPHISLQIGSVVRAREIDMHLQNIRGQVHFRGTWAILQNLRSRHIVLDAQSK